MIPRIGIAAALLLLLIPADGRGADRSPPFELALPLPADLPATASFAEYRSDHLHSGIDFSTRGELGWEVRAAADGEIFRLKVQERGYGKAIYMRHAGGYVTVYGHLHAFEEEVLELETFLKAEQERRGTRYPGDLYADPPLRVRRGQTIALSGESGGGPPHLHFELRQGDEPVDPVRTGGLRPAGFAAPVLDALWVIPRGACRVDGRWGAQRLPFRREGGQYRLQGRPAIEGRFDLALTARVPGAGTMGLNGLSLECDGDRLFRAELSRFSFQQYRQSGLLFDMARTGSSPTRYTYRLRAAAGMDLPGVEGAWLRPLDEGDHHCRLEASDSFGRRAVAEFTLEVLPAPPYDGELPERVAGHELFDGLLLLDGNRAFDPRRLPEGHRGVPGFPEVYFPGRRGMVAVAPGGTEVIVPAGASYGAGPISLAEPSQLPDPEPGLELVTPPFRLGPAGLFLREPAILRARVDLPAGTAFYRLGAGGSTWDAVGGEMRAGLLEGKVRTGGVYAVLRDRSAPRITGVRLRREERLDAARLVFPVAELGQGIDVEACTVTLDGRPVEATYDPDRRWAEVWLAPEDSGTLAVRAECRDRAGNTSEIFQASVEL